MNEFSELPAATQQQSAPSGTTSFYEGERGWKVVCISDTHSYSFDPQSLPAADVIIHAGDFTNVGLESNIQSFLSFFGDLPHRNKVFIAGNHDITLHHDFYKTGEPAMRFHPKLARTLEFNPVDYSRRCIDLVQNFQANQGKMYYLEDESVFLLSDVSEARPLHIYGSPWQPEFCDWAFNLPLNSAEIASKWAMIPDDVDVLVTHGPPHGILDRAVSGHLCGCPILLREIQQRIKPRVHVFGHIHETYGAKFVENILYINASTCTFQYRPTNPPIEFFLPFDLSKPAKLITQFPELN